MGRRRGVAGSAALPVVLVALFASFAIAASYNAHEADEARAPQTLAAPLGDTSDAQQQQRQQRKREDVKLTTLLEDEDQERATSGSGSGSGVSYGKLVRRQDEAEAAPAASLFGRLYANVSHYLPFLNQISILRRPQAQEAAERRVASDLPTLAPGQGEAKRAPARQSDAGRPSEQEATAPAAFAALQPAKQAVSAIKATGEGREADKSGGGGGNHLRARLNASDEGAAAVASKRLDQEGKDEEREHDHELDQMIASEQRGQPMSGQFSLMRQSNLVVPLHEGDARAQDSLLGKYIYAPAQHYYLNGASGPATNSMRGAHEAAASYEQLRSAYAFQKEPGLLNFASLLGPGQPATAAAAGGAPKSNDLYFLVMVGAFCVMAMAVVLAAGLFAYRVQQQRKSSQAPEYPTYGVVGPNNMGGGVGGVGQALNGKCGNAAAFMGGYFNHAHAGALGGAPGKPAGKPAAAADLYAAAAAAAAAANIDSGLDKSSSSLVSNASSLKKGSSSTISSGGGANANCANASATAVCGQPGNQDAARMYHYQHQKQQMIISDRSSAGRHTSASDLDSDEEQDDEGSYTVYECPGLASAHEMEIKNPLFHDDQSP